MNEVSLQRDYYTKTAAEYDSAHIGPTEPEHDLAIHFLASVSSIHGFESFLDVGAGTGRGVSFILSRIPSAMVLGVEPVEALRLAGHRKGIPEDRLISGDATQLAFSSDSFDCSFSLGIMHHIPRPRTALLEMLRVSRKAIFISDLNNFGCGSLPQRILSHSLRAVGLWKSFQYIKNGFQNWKYNEGDGVHYSYSLIDDIKFLQNQGCTTYVIGTRPTSSNLLWSCSHVAVLALKNPAPIDLTSADNPL